jgi:hypothetical protein
MGSGEGPTDKVGWKMQQILITNKTNVSIPILKTAALRLVWAGIFSVISSTKNHFSYKS